MCGWWLAKGGNYGQVDVRQHSRIKTYDRIKNRRRPSESDMTELEIKEVAEQFEKTITSAFQLDWIIENIERSLLAELRFLLLTLIPFFQNG